MATWKKVIVSGSAAELKAVSSSLGILIDSENAQSAGYMAISASSTSTASFGHLLGDASQLTNLPETEWDGSRDGDAEISGSLILTGSAGRTPSLEISGYNQGVGTQKIGNTVATTILSGSFSGSFGGSLDGTAGVATKVTVTDNESANESNAIVFTADATHTGNVGLESDGDLTYNPSTGGVTATSFTGSLKGATTGSHNGSVGAATPDSGKFTTLETTGNVTLGSTTSNRVTVAGDLIVNGSTTEVRTTNLNVKDALILLSSGSTGATKKDSGIVFSGNNIGTNSVDLASVNSGSALFVDSDLRRLSITANATYVGASATSLTPGGFVPIITTGSQAAYDQIGNFKVDLNGDLFVYAG